MTKQKSKDQVIREDNPNIFPTLLIILSGVCLYLDKIFVFFNIELSNNHGYSQTEEFIWSLSQTISPIIMVIGLYLKPYKEALIIPLFCYIIQLWFVLDSNLTVDRALTWVYVTGTLIFIILLVVGIQRFLNRKKQLSELKQRVMEKIISKDDQLLNQNENGNKRA